MTKRPRRRWTRAIAGVAIAIAATLVTTTIGGVVATNVEDGRLIAYGQRVAVGDHELNVLDTGSGDQTIVLLPGFGTSSPVIDFAPVVDRLAEHHRVVVVEPFGYGLSDQIDRPRTTANIVGEVHEALMSLGVDRYVLMGHSIAGIYGLAFAERYPDEVEAFVGIDTSVPGQPGRDASFPTGLLAAARATGLLRVAIALGGDDGYGGADYTDRDRDQIGILRNRNTLAPTYLDEMSRIGSNFAQAADATFPADLPLLLFTVAENPVNPDWVALHREQAATVADGTVVPLAGDHYLHHTRAAEIAERTDTWIGERFGAAATS